MSDGTPHIDAAGRATAGEIAALVQGTLRGDAGMEISGVCTFASPEAGKLCFAQSLEMLSAKDPTECGALLLGPAGSEQIVRGTVICVAAPRLAFARAAERVVGARRRSGVAQSASIHETAVIGENVTIGENCVIEERAEIGDDSELRHNVIVARGVRIGRRCLIKSNSVVGEEGFGFVIDGGGQNVRIPHVGSVVIEDDVEIGALTTVVAGTIVPTRVGRGVKTDDHVHIAHNCDVGANTLITACVEISGSVTIGENCWIGPNVSIRDGLSIAPGCFIGIGSVVTKSLEVPGVYAGVPARLMKRREDAAAS